MRILAVGASGHVGRLILPRLQDKHSVTVLDPRDPPTRGARHVRASLLEDDTVRRLLGANTDALLYMPLGNGPLGEPEVRDLDSLYDLQVKGLHRVLQHCADAGVGRVVYTSSMSVVPNPGEAEPDVYGFVKLLGEQVCRYASRRYGLTTVCLRLYKPLALEEWRSTDLRAATEAEDVARLVDLALTTPLSGCHVLNTGGDWTNHSVDSSRAAEVLGWKPRARPGWPARLLRAWRELFG